MDNEWDKSHFVYLSAEKHHAVSSKDSFSCLNWMQQNTLYKVVPSIL